MSSSSSSSHTPQRPYNQRNPSRNQKIYVPKNTATATATATASSTTATTTTTTNNNNPSSSSSSSSPSPSSCKPRQNSNINLKPTPTLTTSLRGPSSSNKPRDRSAGASFVKYLPHDEAVASGLGADAGGLDAVESQSVVDSLNDELSKLLRMPPRDFWREVARNDSLREFLDSYLQFRHRWYDFPHRGATGTVAGVIVGEADLCRRVFMVLYRISSNRDPGAGGRDCLSMKDHTALLQGKLLDLPKLFDICAIYGHDNGELTRSLVANAMKAQPQLVDNLSAAVSHFLSIVHTMHQRCSSSLEANDNFYICIIDVQKQSTSFIHVIIFDHVKNLRVRPRLKPFSRLLISSGGHGDHEHGHLLKDYLEVMDFINDAVVTLDAFSDAFNHAPLFLSLSFEMSYGNEELLSTLARLHDSFLPSLYQGFMVISNSGVDATSNISGGSLPNVTLSLRTLSMRIVSLGWKLLDFCYLRNDSIEDVLQTTTKMFPAKVDDPAIRGDIIVQTFRDINGEVLHNLPRISGGTFLQNLEFSYNILRQIDVLRSSGWISIDEDQSQYLYQIATPPHLMSWEKEQKVPINSQNDKLPIDEDSIIIESKISQIKDLFPEYGKGFLSACLQVYNQNPEEVIQRILEGTLHNDLLSLDTSLEQVPPPKSVSQNQSDKGKGKLVEPISLNPSDKGKGKLVEPTSHSSNILPSNVDLAAARKAQESVYSSSSHGRFMRKSKGNVDEPDSKILDSMAAKNSIRSAVLAAEYDDEYDDSFDDLGLSVVGSGFEETENSSDVISSSGGSSSRWSKKKTQFYVKDGKNYSYKVAGSVAVSSSQEAALVNQAQKETIHGLGQGGNIPLGAVKRVMDAEGQDHQNLDAQENSDSGGSNFRGRGGRRGGGGGRGSHFRKDRAMKKHFQSLGGH